MSLQHVLAIIERAINDDQFRDDLLRRPKVVTQAFELDPAEAAMLKNLANDSYTSCRRGLMDVKRIVQAAIDYSQ